MKKKLIIPLAITGSLLAGYTAGAASQYIGQIESHTESEKERLEQRYTTVFSEHEAEGLDGYTQEEKQRMTDAMNAYTDKKAKEDAQQAVEQQKKDISKATDQGIQELEKYVDGVSE